MPRHPVRRRAHDDQDGHPARVAAPLLPNGRAQPLLVDRARSAVRQHCLLLRRHPSAAPQLRAARPDRKQLPMFSSNPLS